MDYGTRSFGQELLLVIQQRTVCQVLLRVDGRMDLLLGNTFVDARSRNWSKLLQKKMITFRLVDAKVQRCHVHTFFPSIVAVESNLSTLFIF